MPRPNVQRFTQKLIDWLIALSISFLVLWFVFKQPVYNQNLQTQVQAVDTKKLKQHVQLLTNGYAPRTINYDNLNHTADYIYRQLSTFGIPEYQTITTVAQQYKNVVLQIGPDTKELYVIGAHYDAEDDSIDTEGNASGVATLIELARHLAENINKLEIGVVLVAYPLSLNQSDSEVNTGSYFHAKSLKAVNKEIRLMISLDSIGQIKNDSSRKKYPYKFLEFLYPSTHDSINVVGRLKDFGSIREFKKGFKRSSESEISTYNLPESFNKTQSSDHISYWKQGYPAVLISDVLFEDKNITLSDIPQADPQERLDYEKMAGLVDSLYQVIIQAETTEEDKTQLAQRAKDKLSIPLLY